MTRERGRRGLVLAALALIAVVAMLDLLRNDSFLRSRLTRQPDPADRVEQVFERVLEGTKRPRR